MFKLITKYLKKIHGKRSARKVKNKPLEADFYLHTYESYEQYKETQIFYNREKLDNIWADEVTLDRVCRLVKKYVTRDIFAGICHGTRNGFEQYYISEKANFSAFGTDISPTANDFPKSVEWDFHDEKAEWINCFDFVYSNSLDQGWDPRKALMVWLNQIHKDGVVIIEHTVDHGPRAAGEMDPFGVRPKVMPYVLVDWFGQQISLSFEEGQKSNKDLKAWLFVIRKNVETVTYSDVVALEDVSY